MAMPGDPQGIIYAEPALRAAPAAVRGGRGALRQPVGRGRDALGEPVGAARNLAVRFPPPSVHRRRRREGDRDRGAVRAVLRHPGRDPVVAHPQDLQAAAVAEADEPPRDRHASPRSRHRRRAAAAVVGRHRDDDDLPPLRRDHRRAVRPGRRDRESARAAEIQGRTARRRSRLDRDARPPRGRAFPTPSSASSAYRASPATRSACG